MGTFIHVTSPETLLSPYLRGSVKTAVGPYSVASIVFGSCFLPRCYRFTAELDHISVAVWFDCHVIR